MFEMTFSDGKRRGMAFDGYDAHPVYVTPNGSAITRKDWPKMKRTLAYDDNELSPSGERDGFGTQEDLAKLRAAIKKMALKSGMDDGEYQEMLDRVLEHHGQSDGAAATDRQRRARDAGPLDGHGVPGDEDDDENAAVEGKIRGILAGMGWDDEKIEAALVKHRAAAAKDRLPVPATKGGMGGYRSGVSKSSERGRYPGEADVLDEFPGSEYTRPDIYGEPNSERLMRDADRDRGERIMPQLRGDRAGRRLAGDAVSCMDDADLAKEYPGIENVRAGAF